MFGWLKRRSPVPPSFLAMIGPRASDEVLFLGAKNPALAAEVGTVTRLNGRTVVVGRGADAAKRAERAETQAGAILEFVEAPFTALPFDAATFHIVVLTEVDWKTAEHTAWLAEAARVLRPGGRIIIVEALPGRGAGQSAPATDVVQARLTASGFIAARRLAQTDGMIYYEGRKARA
jgi:SAM-dependent methyltransferase